MRKAKKLRSLTGSDALLSSWGETVLADKNCKSLETAFSDAVWDKEAKGRDERLDDGSTDIDSLDAFEYTIERDMRELIQEAEDV